MKRMSIPERISGDAVPYEQKNFSFHTSFTKVI